MDPLTHTLAGAALARTGLERWSRGATFTLVVGANLPDLDALSYLAGADAALAFRRGWTHGILAVALLPLVLTAAVVGWQRWRQRRRPPPQGAPLRPGRLLSLATLAVASHPLLDWLNSYGVRLLYPFDGRWFYGDALFIVEPWLWLVLGGAVLLTTAPASRSLRLGAASAVALAFLVAAVHPPRTGAATWLWLALLAGVVLAAAWGRAPTTPRHRRTLATGALVVATLYAGSMTITGRLARRWVVPALAEAGVTPVTGLMVAPEPLDPRWHGVVAAFADGYRAGLLTLGPSPHLALAPKVFSPVPETGPARAAWNAPSVKGFRNWARYPTAVVTPRGDGWEVSLFDLRYRLRPTRGFGGAVVTLDRTLRPVTPR